MQHHNSYPKNQIPNDMYNYSGDLSQSRKYPSNYDSPTVGKKISTPFSYKKKSYEQYLNPNFV
jgi:hypothetical protein